MLRVLMIPLSALILIENVAFLDVFADGLRRRFDGDLQNVACARDDVFRRNLQDAYAYLARLYPYVKERGFYPDEFLDEPPDGCSGTEASVYREVNSRLPAIYPNWIYREGIREEGSESESRAFAQKF